MQIGDVIVTKPVIKHWSAENVVSWLISKACKGKTHVGIYAGFGRVAHLDINGFRLDKLADFLKERVIAQTVPMRLSNWQKIKLYYHLFTHKNTKYNITHLFRLAWWLIRTPKKVPNTLTGHAVCSTFAAHVLNRAGVVFAQPTTLITPKNFF